MQVLSTPRREKDLTAEFSFLEADRVHQGMLAITRDLEAFQSSPLKPLAALLVTGGKHLSRLVKDVLQTIGPDSLEMGRKTDSRRRSRPSEEAGAGHRHEMLKQSMPGMNPYELLTGLQPTKNSSLTTRAHDNKAEFVAAEIDKCHDNRRSRKVASQHRTRYCREWPGGGSGRVGYGAKDDRLCTNSMYSNLLMKLAPQKYERVSRIRAPAGGDHLFTSQERPLHPYIYYRSPGSLTEKFTSTDSATLPPGDRHAFRQVLLERGNA